MDEYYRAVRQLPSWLAQPLGQLPTPTAAQIHELRFRTGHGIFSYDVRSAGLPGRNFLSVRSHCGNAYWISCSSKRSFTLCAVVQSMHIRTN